MNHKPKFFGAIAIFALTIVGDFAFAQKDNVYLIKNEDQRGTTKITGKVTITTPDSITIQEGSNAREIPAHTIKKIVFSDEPSALERARDRLFDGRYDDCLSELQKITAAPTSTLIQREIEYLTAYSNAQLALRGGDVTAQVAGQGINAFIKNNPDAYQFFPAVDLMGKLLMGIGRVDLATEQFDRLSQAQSADYQIDGFFQKGNALMVQEKWDEAKTCFDQVVQIDATSSLVRQFKLAAQCQLARIKALKGDPATAKSEIEAIIKSESEENEIVFSYAYIGLGTCHELLGDLKSAALAYLHNDLLFVSQHEPRAEALFRLSMIWPKLDDADAANRARSTLLSRYRNSIWASKL